MNWIRPVKRRQAPRATVLRLRPQRRVRRRHLRWIAWPDRCHGRASQASGAQQKQRLGARAVSRSHGPWHLCVAPRGAPPLQVHECCCCCAEPAPHEFAPAVAPHETRFPGAARGEWRPMLWLGHRHRSPRPERSVPAVAVLATLETSWRCWSCSPPCCWGCCSTSKLVLGLSRLVQLTHRCQVLRRATFQRCRRRSRRRP